MILKPTYFVSFPRSGHHWTVKMLNRYFGDTVLHYCESYDRPDLKMAVCPETNLEKTHDFDLSLNAGTYQLLVLHRLDIAAGWRSWHKAEKSMVSLTQFVYDHEIYWLKFLARYTGPVKPGEQRLLFTYEELRSNPVQTLIKVVNFLTTDHVIDLDKLTQAILAELDWRRLGLPELEAGGFRYKVVGAAGADPATPCL